MNNDSIFLDFQALYRASRLTESENFIIKDGIINTELYNSQKRKILLIAKEHNFINKLKYPNGYEGDYRYWWDNHLNYTFSHRISEWSFGVADDFRTPYEEISWEQKMNALRSIAFINVKKTGGGSSSNPNTILSYIEASRDLLQQQITAVDPDLIICCFRHDFYVSKLLEVSMERVPTNHYSLGTWQDRKVINSYHPSSRKGKKFLFDQIREAVRT
ncbi:hypothetical protein [Spirosoma arcticum]